MKRFAAALALLVSAIPRMAAAQEIELQPHRARTSTCRQHCVKLLDRLTFASSIGVTLQDEFDRSIWSATAVTYRLGNVASIGIWAGFATAHVPTSLTGAIRQQSATGGTAPGSSPIPAVNSTPNIPLGENFDRQVGRLDWMASAPQVTVFPLRGKFLLFQHVTFEAEFFLFAGPALVGVTERANFDVGQNPPVFTGPGGLFENQVQRQSRVVLTGTFGGGINFFVTRFIALGAEYRAFPFAWNTAGFDVNSTSQRCGVATDQSCAGFPDFAVPRDTTGSRDVGGRFIVNADDQRFHWNHMFNVSLTLLVPVGSQRGRP